MNNLFPIFQNCIYCRDDLCGNIDCNFYSTTNVSAEELNDHSSAACNQLVNEICDKLGIVPGVGLYPIYKQLLLCNKKI